MSQGLTDESAQIAQCANCGGAGPDGTPCLATPRCAQVGYHHIPSTPLIAATDPLRPRDPHLGLAFGDYVVLEPLGKGGLGAVYIARHRATGQRAALKLLTDMRFNAYFEREARSLAKLTHRHIVRIYHFGEAHQRAYLVMEYVRGHSLHAQLKRPTTPATFRRILEQVLAALAHAHRRGVLHRDIKPSNIMLQVEDDDGPFVRLVDFGLAREVANTLQTNMVVGSPAYMAPEHLQSGEQGPWTDLYAVGCLAFLALTGRTPYAGLKQVSPTRNGPPSPCVRPSGQPPSSPTQGLPRHNRLPPSALFGAATERWARIASATRSLSTAATCVQRPQITPNAQQSFAGSPT